MASSNNGTDTGIFSSVVPSISLLDTTAGSLSLPLTAASSTTEPNLSSITWGSIGTSSIFSSSAFESSIPTSAASSPSALVITSEPFTTTTYDASSSNFISSSVQTLTLGVETTDSVDVEGYLTTSSQQDPTRSTTIEAPVSSSYRDRLSSTVDVTTEQATIQTTVHAKSSTENSWSLYTYTSSSTSDGNVVIVTYTSSTIVGITQATTVGANVAETSARAGEATGDANQATSEPSGSGGTKKSTKIAVGVVVPVGALSLIGLGFYYMRRRNKHVVLANESSPSERDSEENAARHSKHNSINAHHMF